MFKEATFQPISGGAPGRNPPLPPKLKIAIYRLWLLINGRNGYSIF